MSRKNRFDKLRNAINQDFNRAVTLSPALSGNERQKLVGLDDHTDTYAISDRLEKFGPFNAIYVRNFSAEDIRVYLTPDRSLYVTIAADSNQAIPVTERVPKRYVRFLEVENLGGNAISEGDLEIEVGNEVDSLEYELLTDAGLLDV